MAVEARHVNLSNQQRNFVYNRQMVENLFPIQQIQTSESGLTFNQQLPTTPRKRSRDHSFTTPQITKRIRLQLEEQQKHEWRMLVAAIGARVMNKLKEKDEEIVRIGKMNLVLQERVKSIYTENQLWRDLAHTNEATANSLRRNLERLLAHVNDDVESCCSSSSSNEEDTSNRMCRRCGERESCVLLLPCRHLCLCTLCASTLHHACPICNSNMNATLHVNMSS